MNLKNTNAMPDNKTLTHHGDSTSRFSIDSSLRDTKFLFKESRRDTEVPIALCHHAFAILDLIFQMVAKRPDFPFYDDHVMICNARIHMKK